MAIYSLNMRLHSRSQGKSAAPAVAYILRTPIHNAYTGLVCNPSKTSGLAAAALILPNKPPQFTGSNGAVQPDIRDAIQHIVDCMELSDRRKNSTVAREIVIALPHELSLEDRHTLMLEFAGKLTARYRCPIIAASHSAPEGGNELNVHAHLVMATRIYTDGQLGRKTRELDDLKQRRIELAHIRKLWADTANAALAAANIDARIDHRSHATRGIQTIPQIHLGAASTTLLRQNQSPQHEVSKTNPRLQKYHDIDRSNQDIVALLTEMDELNAEFESATAVKPEAQHKPLLATEKLPPVHSPDQGIAVRPRTPAKPTVVASSPIATSRPPQHQPLTTAINKAVRASTTKPLQRPGSLSVLQRLGRRINRDLINTAALIARAGDMALLPYELIAKHINKFKHHTQKPATPVQATAVTPPITGTLLGSNTPPRSIPEKQSKTIPVVKPGSSAPSVPSATTHTTSRTATPQSARPQALPVTDNKTSSMPAKTDVPFIDIKRPPAPTPAVTREDKIAAAKDRIAAREARHGKPLDPGFSP